MAVCFAMTSTGYSQEIGPYEFSIKVVKEHVKQAEKTLENIEWLSFKINKKYIEDGKLIFENTYYVTFHYDLKNSFVAVDNPEHFRRIKIDRKHYIEIEKDCCTYSIYTKGKRDRTTLNIYKEHGLRSRLGFYFPNLWYYFIPMENKIKASSTASMLVDYEDDTINGVPYRKYISHDGMMRTYNEETDKFDIPIDCKNQLFVNMTTGMLDSIYVSGITECVENQEFIYTMSDFQYTDRQEYIDKIFDPDNEEYANFTHHDESNPAYMMKYSRSDNDKMNDSISNFPLVSLDGKTETIKDTEGWILLDLWSSGCSPCLEQLQRFGTERDSLGSSILEKEGIKIFAVDYKTNDMEILKSVVQRVNAEQFVYSGKGINLLLKMPYLGYYYLISPDKEIIYETAVLGDYSDLLKAKKEYEERNKK